MMSDYHRVDGRRVMPLLSQGDLMQAVPQELVAGSDE